MNKGRDKKNRITYSSLRVHAKRHYELAGITDYWEARLDKEMKNVLGVTFEDLLNCHQQVPLTSIFRGVGIDWFGLAVVLGFWACVVAGAVSPVLLWLLVGGVGLLG